MRIGVPREIKDHEHRVGLTPEAVRELTRSGHSVLVETGAGTDAGFTDSEYLAAEAELSPDAARVYRDCDLVVKVKEPQLQECELLSADQILFAYLHLAADREQTLALMNSGTTAFAYETVTGHDGSLPLLAPMSRIAGRLSVQVGAHELEKPSGGAGILLGGVPGVLPGKVVVLGAGVSGQSAVEIAVGLQASVIVIDVSMRRLGEISARFGNRVQTVYSTKRSIAKQVADADLLIGCVLVPGAAAPQLVTRAMIANMRPRSVVVDVSIDQGGCFETSRPTTHSKPTYVEEGVVHYCVTNMPGAVPRTSTIALSNATLPFVKALADSGWQNAYLADAGLGNGLNVHAGRIYNKQVAESLDIELSDRPVAA